MSTFKNLELNEKILSALDAKGYTTPTPIQLQAIPHVMEGKDFLGIAQTGTGKTAAFSLPILHNLAKNPVSAKSGCMRVLVLTPTRELASQIAENIEIYGKELGLRHAIIFGGVSERPQITAMQRGVDILIATPGRLLDLSTQGHIRYMQLEVLVLDEADRMLDMGFINDVKKIIHKIPEKRQTLFFSATMPETIADLANSILKNPVTVEVTPQATTVEKIEQKVYFVDKSHKPALLKTVLKQDEVKHILVFCKMKHGANKVVEHLQAHGIKVAAIHGNKSQGAREKALSDFRSGAIEVLVATDIAARGIDIPAISHVINYDIPMDPASYVHRIGRTARAGREGVAISFCDPSEIKYLREVEKTIKYKIPVDETHAYHGVEAAAGSSRDREEYRPARGRPAPRNRGERNFSGNSSSRPTGNRRPEGRSDAPRRDFRSRDGQAASAPTGEKKMFGLFGFGKKKEDSTFTPRPRADRDDNRRRDDKPRGERPFGRRGEEQPRGERRFDSPRSPNRFDSPRSGSSDRRLPRDGAAPSRFNDEGADKKKSFGFGWFKKSTEARDPSQRSDHRGGRRPDSDFGNNRKRTGGEVDGNKTSYSGSTSRNYAGSGSRRPSSGGARPSGFGSNRSSSFRPKDDNKKW